MSTSSSSALPLPLLLRPAAAAFGVSCAPSAATDFVLPLLVILDPAPVCPFASSFVPGLGAFKCVAVLPALPLLVAGAPAIGSGGSGAFGDFVLLVGGAEVDGSGSGGSASGSEGVAPGRRSSHLPAWISFRSVMAALRDAQR